MRFEFQTDQGMTVRLHRGVVSRLSADLMTPSGDTIASSDLAPLLQVDNDLVEAARAHGGVHSMIVRMSSADLSLSILVLRGGDSVALVLIDLARADILQWLGTALVQRYLPVALLGDERAIQVRLPVDQTVSECHEAGQRSRPAEHEELFSAYSAVLDLLNDGDFLRQVSINPKSVRLMSLAVVSEDDKPAPKTTGQPGGDSGHLH